MIFGGNIHEERTQHRFKSKVCRSSRDVLQLELNSTPWKIPAGLTESEAIALLTFVRFVAGSLRV